MNCIECRELLAGYIEGLLDEQQKVAIESHLAGCPNCTSELEQAKALQKHLLAEGRQESQSDLENTVMNRIVREQAFQLRKVNQDKQHVNIWRLIMRNRLAQFAAAAVIIIAVLAGIYLITGKPLGVTCCAGAKIADKIGQFKTCVCNIHIQQSGAGLGQNGQQIDSKMYLSSDYGYKIETSLNGKVMQQMYIITGDNAIILVMPAEKKYMRMVLTENYLAQMKSQMQDPRFAVTNFMTGQFKELGEDVIDGVEVKSRVLRSIIPRPSATFTAILSAGCGSMSPRNIPCELKSTPRWEKAQTK